MNSTLRSLAPISLIVLCLFGCAQTDNKPTSSENEQITQEATEGDSSSEVDDSTAFDAPASSLEQYPIEQIGEAPISVFIDNDGTCTRLESLPFNNTPGGGIYPLDSEFEDVQGGTFTQVSLSEGERVLTTINDQARYRAVDEVGYFGGSQIVGFTPESEINGVVVGGDGISLYSNVEQILNSMNIDLASTGSSDAREFYGIFNMLFSTEPTSFNLGSYQGTDWVEETVEINRPCYTLVQEEEGDLPVEKTKEGYFIIDCSSLSPGRYMLQSGNASFLIEIR